MHKTPQELAGPPVQSAPLAGLEHVLEAQGRTPDDESRQRRTMSEIVRESALLYFLPITATVQFARKLARRTWMYKP